MEIGLDLMNGWHSVMETPPLQVGDEGYRGYIVYANGYLEIADYAPDKYDNVPYFHVDGEYEPDVQFWMLAPLPPHSEDNYKKYGTWIPLGHRMGLGKHPFSEDFQCSECGYEQYTVYLDPPERCPHCRAQMSKAPNDEKSCDTCRYAPPSSLDGKPCTMCDRDDPLTCCWDPKESTT